jgi:hypothetical protein
MVDMVIFKKSDKTKIRFCLGFSIGSDLGFYFTPSDSKLYGFWVIYYPYYYIIDRWEYENFKSKRKS